MKDVYSTNICKDLRMFLSLIIVVGGGVGELFSWGKKFLTKDQISLSEFKLSNY